MNKSLKDIELQQFIKSFLKKDYPKLLSKDFSSQIMNRIQRIQPKEHFFGYVLKTAAAASFALISLFIVQSLYISPIEYSNSDIDKSKLIAPTKNVSIDDCPEDVTINKKSNKPACR